MAMMHTIKAGENLISIAKAYGISDWRTIYNDPGNNAFRVKRPNPNLVYPGDRLLIPAKPKTPAPVSPKVSFSLTIQDSIVGQNVANLTTKLRLPNGVVKELTTDRNGKILITHPDVTAGKVDVLEIWDRTVYPHINYSPAIPKTLATDASNVLKILDKRQIADSIILKHNIARRTVWGKQTPKYFKMDYDWNYNTIVIHHSGNGGETDPMGIENLHMTKNGWDDVGYHYLIRPDGSIYEGRSLVLKGSHVEQANTGKIGILLMGDYEDNFFDFSNDSLQPKQLISAIELIKTLKGSFGQIKNLGGHRDYKQSTECPGGELYKILPQLRAYTGLGGP